VLVSNLGGVPTTQEIVIGPSDEDAESRAVVLQPGVAAVGAWGPDQSEDTADDQLVLLSDLGGTNTALFLTVGGVSGGSTSELTRLGPSSVALASGGPDGAHGGGDDDYAVLDGVGGLLHAEGVPAGGDFDEDYSNSFVIAALGDGRAAHLASGPDGDLGAGGDDAVQVLGEVGSDAPIAVQKLKISAGSKGEKLKATVQLPDDMLAELGGADLQVGVGSVTQTIPADALVAKKNSITFKDKTSVIQSVKISLKKGTLTVKGKGSGTGLDATDPDYVPVSVEVGGDYRATAVAASPTKNGVKYKAPK
jgi:hypothetical protein